MSSSRLHKHLVEAWQITMNWQKIRWFNFWWSLIDTIILSITLIYQLGHVSLDIMEKKSEFFLWLRDVTVDLIGEHRITLISSVVFVGMTYFLVNFLIKNIFNAGLIYLIKAYNNKSERDYSNGRALAFGWWKSVKLAEYHSLLFWSKPVYIFYIFFWGYQFLEANWSLIATIAVIFMIALIVTRFIFEYARYYIITENKGVFESLGLSLTMTLENISITWRIFLSLILVYIRELILLVGIFTLPFVMSWLVALGLWPVFLQGVILIIGLVYLIFLIIVSAMNSTIELFVESLWYAVFRENLGQSHSDSHAHHQPPNHHSEHH